MSQNKLPLDELARLAAEKVQRERPERLEQLKCDSTMELADKVERAVMSESTVAFEGYGERDFYASQEAGVVIIINNKDPDRSTIIPHDRPVERLAEFKPTEAGRLEKPPLEVDKGGFVALQAAKNERTLNADAKYFAASVDDPEKFPPKNDEMAQLVADRQSDEQLESSWRVSSGGPAELTGANKEAQMQDRADFYIASQQQMSKGF